MKELDEIRARLEAAAPGPWAVLAGSEAHGVDYAEGSITWDDHGGEVFKPADAELIANAPTDLARLLAAVEAVEALAIRAAALCEPGEWPESGSIADAAVSDWGRAYLAAITAALTPIPVVLAIEGEGK